MNVIAKTAAKNSCSDVTFTGLMTWYMPYVPAAVSRAVKPNTKARACPVPGAGVTLRAAPAHSRRFCAGMASGDSAGVVFKILSI